MLPTDRRRRTGVFRYTNAHRTDRYAASQFPARLSRSSSQRPPLLWSFEPILRCPDRRCAKKAYGSSGDLLTLTCVIKAGGCGAHWWATWLYAGDVRSQIRSQFDGNEIFVQLLDEMNAPERVDHPGFWQIWLTGNEHYRMMDRSSPGGILGRTHEFMRSLSGLLRKAS